MRQSELPVLIVGAGPAGLATAAELTRRGVAYRLVERGDSLGQTWVDLYDSLVLHTGRHMSTLAGMGYPSGTPLFPRRDDFIAYLREYAHRFDIRVETRSPVAVLVRHEDGWRALMEGGGEIDARAVVVATGIVANPLLPDVRGRGHFAGEVLHSSAYKRPAGYEGKRVLVVGVGNSGGEIGSELASAGAHVTMLVRSGANVVPREIAGIPMQYCAWLVRKLPRPAQNFVVRQVQAATIRTRGAPVIPPKGGSPLDAIPIIGFHLVDAIKRGAIALKLGAIDTLTRDGVRFSDGSEQEFDVVMLATGFRAALAPLGALVRTDAKGFALRSDRVTSVDQPSLWFVGHNYDAAGGIANIRRDAALAADAIVRADR